MKKIFFLVFAALSVSFNVSAHESGLSLEAEKDGYVIDVGYSDEFSAKRPIRFDLILLDSETKVEESFSATWVRISKGMDTLFAGSIGVPSFGLSGFTFSFPEEGIYDLSVRYENEKGSIVQYSFPVSVAKETSENPVPVYVLILVAVLILVVAPFVIKPLFSKKNK